MHTYQYFIDDIQSAVYSPETADPDFLRDAAAQYAEACAEANQRLRQVAQLLRRGLRSEALQLTEEEPNLLDLVGMLDFPELPAWRELLKQWRMAPPPALLIDLAADINQAYADHQPLESVLKQHRLLALARAPLASRVRTLRQIRRADPANMAWEEDLKILETARVKQMDFEIETLHRRDDLNALTGVKEELDVSDWVISRPSSLKTKVDRLHHSLSAKLARKELERLEQDLNAAHMAFDEASGLQIRKRWNELARTAELLPDETLAQHAAPALEWLGDLERRQSEQVKRRRAMAAVEEALENTAPREELERLYQAVLIFDEPVPPKLKHRVEQRLAAQALATQRRHRIVLAGIASAVILVGAMIGYAIVEQKRQTTVSGATEALHAMINDGRLDEAQAFYDQIAAATPEIATSPKIQAEKSLLSDALSAQIDRRQAFARAMAQAKAAPLTNPDRTALAEVRRLAESSGDQQSVAELESQIAGAARKTQQEHDTAISERLAQFRESLKAIEALDHRENQEANQELSGLAEDIESVRNQFANANPAVLAQLDPLVARIKAIRKSNDQEDQRARAQAAITSAIGNMAGFRAALTEYALQFPDSEIASNIALLDQESKTCEGFVAWHLFVSDLLRDLDSIDSGKSREFIAAGDQLEKSHSTMQIADLYRMRRPQLESIVSRMPADGPPLVEELRKLFRDPLVGSLWMVERNDGLRFYCRKEPVTVNGSVRFNFLAGFDLEEKPQSIRETDVSYRARAPQSIIATRAIEMLDAASVRDWEKHFTTLLNSIATDQRLDPILKITLLQRVLKVADTGSAAVHEGFAQFRSEVDGANIDASVKWMDPRDSTAQAERKRAEVLLQGLPPIAEATLATARNIRRLRGSADYSYRWIGWLARDPNDAWTVIARDIGNDEGDLVVVALSTNKTTVEPMIIGRVEQLSARLDSGSSSGLLVGRPVFLRVKVIPTNQK